MAEEITFLGTGEPGENPPILYKYRTWSNHYHKTILTKQSVFLASPSTFEDQFDCKSLMRYDWLTPIQIYEKYYKHARKVNPKWDELDCRKYATEWFLKSPLHDQNYTKNFMQDYFVDFDKRFGVLSLTANPSNSSMWIKYAEGHQGLCVGFDTEHLFAPGHLGGGGEVRYCDELPQILPSDNLHLEHYKQVFFKERKWDFEQEYRTHKFWPTVATNADRTRLLPPECFKEVIFGAMMEDKYKEEVKAICAAKNLQVEFSQARIVNGLTVNDRI